MCRRRKRRGRDERATRWAKIGGCRRIEGVFNDSHDSTSSNMGTSRPRESAESLRDVEVDSSPLTGAGEPSRARRSTRSYSLSGFTFEEELLPLTLSESTAEASPAIPKNVGVVKGLLLPSHSTQSNQVCRHCAHCWSTKWVSRSSRFLLGGWLTFPTVGSGIFSSPGVIVANTNSVGASLLVWIAGCLLGWTGASSFAELGCAIPLNGGAQAYLNHAFNPLISYLFAWTAISVRLPLYTTPPKCSHGSGSQTRRQRNHCRCYIPQLA
jgi:hypothetical protein